jgi:hypothetical protein
MYVLPLDRGIYLQFRIMLLQHFYPTHFKEIFKHSFFFLVNLIPVLFLVRNVTLKSFRMVFCDKISHTFVEQLPAAPATKLAAPWAQCTL